MKFIATIVILIILTFNTRQTFAQSCQQKPEDAKRAWYNGQLREGASILNGCLDNELAINDRSDACKLIADLKLLLNEEDEADMKLLLPKNAKS